VSAELGLLIKKGTGRPYFPLNFDDKTKKSLKDWDLSLDKGTVAMK